MALTDLHITETSIPNYNDLKIWYRDYYEVEKEVNRWLRKCVVLDTVEEMLDYVIDCMHHNNAFSICSDTHEPIEYVDFNYGSLTCTISIYDRTQPELLKSFEGYIRRNGEELADCYMDINCDEIESVLG